MYRKIIPFLIISIMICLINTKSFATESKLNNLFQNNIPNIGKRIVIEKEAEETNLYSVEKNKIKKNGTYNIIGYLKITGSKAESVTGTKKINKLNGNNAILAYILNNNNKRETQNLIWNWMDNWQTNVGNNLGYTWKINTQKSNLTEIQKQYIELATRYANMTPNIKTKGDTNIKISNNLSGPYKIKYTGMIEQIIVKNQKGEEITNGIEIYLDTKMQNQITSGEIKSGKNFYIKNNSGQSLSTVTIQMKKTPVIKAEIWFMNNLKESNAQKMMYVKTYKTEEAPRVTIQLNEKSTEIVPAVGANQQAKQKVSKTNIENMENIERTGILESIGNIEHINNVGNRTNVELYEIIIIIVLLNIISIQIIICQKDLNKLYLQKNLLNILEK